MRQFDEKELAGLGITGLPAEREKRFAAALLEELEMRVGGCMSEKLTERKMNEFLRIVGDVAVKRWLEENVPDYKIIIETCEKELRAEVSRYSAWIMEGDIQVLLLPIESLTLSVHAYTSLKRGGINKVADIVTRTDQQLLSMRNFNRSCLNELSKILTDLGLNIPMRSADRKGVGSRE